MIRILLVEDQEIVRSGVKYLLERSGGFEIVGEALNENEALSILNSTPVDIILMDAALDDADTIGIINQKYPETQIVILTTHHQEQHVIDAFRKGANGYLFKNVSTDELIFGIEQVYRKKKYICVDLSERLFNNLLANTTVSKPKQLIDFEFSKRELEILILIADGFTNQEIADKLFTSRRTVEGHRQSLIDKTGSKNTSALVGFAIRNGIIK